MKYSFSIAVLCALGLSASSACLAAAQAKAPAKPGAKEPVQEEGPPVLAVPEGYRYNPEGRRDPFLNPVPKPTPAAQAEAAAAIARPPGLRGVLLSEVRITGIVTSKDPGMTKVVLVTSGRKTYFAGRGEALFDAVIKEIRPDSVVFSIVSPTTRQPTNEDAVRTVGTSAGENK